MFTIQNFQNAQNYILQKRGNSVYSLKENQVSLHLSELSPTDRGTCVEYMIVERMSEYGVDATHIGGSNAKCDISLYVGGGSISAEVKSSVLGPKSQKYYFQGIKPECFDIIFFAFIHPSRGLIIKTAGVKSIKLWASKYDRVRKTDGYDIYFDLDMINKKIPTIVWNPSEEGITI